MFHPCIWIIELHVLNKRAHFFFKSPPTSASFSCILTYHTLSHHTDPVCHFLLPCACKCLLAVIWKPESVIHKALKLSLLVQCLSIPLLPSDGAYLHLHFSHKTHWSWMCTESAFPCLHYFVHCVAKFSVAVCLLVTQRYVTECTDWASTLYWHAFALLSLTRWGIVKHMEYSGMSMCLNTAGVSFLPSFAQISLSWCYFWGVFFVIFFSFIIVWSLPYHINCLEMNVVIRC